MPHPDEGLIHAWLDGELDAAEAARVEALVASDVEWAAAAAEARGLVAASARIVGALDSVPGNVIPKQVPRVRAPRRWAWRAAAVLALMAGSAVVLERRTPELPVPDAVIARQEARSAGAPVLPVNPPATTPPATTPPAVKAPAPRRASARADSQPGAGAAAKDKSSGALKELDSVKSFSVVHAQGAASPMNDLRGAAAATAAPAPPPAAVGVGGTAREKFVRVQPSASNSVSRPIRRCASSGSRPARWPTASGSKNSSCAATRSPPSTARSERFVFDAWSRKRRARFDRGAAGMSHARRPPERPEHGAPRGQRAEHYVQVEGIETPPDQRAAEDRWAHHAAERELEAELHRSTVPPGAGATAPP